MTTRLRSTPTGRGGLRLGNSPALMRSVQSASAARWPPSGVISWVMKLTMSCPAGPTDRRCDHASRDDFEMAERLGDRYRVA